MHGYWIVKGYITHGDNTASQVCTEATESEDYRTYNEICVYTNNINDSNNVYLYSALKWHKDD